MKNTYVECLDWTWPEKLLYIKSCVGDEIPHNMLCGYAAHSKDEILTEYMHAKYLYCNERGMMSYDDRDLSKPVISRNQRKVELSELKLKRTRTEYEKVTESIFDLRDEFERGELYCKHEHAREYTQITNTQALAQALHGGFCFRKVEKVVNWKEEVYAWQHTRKVGIYTPLDFTVAHLISAHPDKFLELCRVALRANGELD